MWLKVIINVKIVKIKNVKLAEIVRLLKKGGVAVLPTDTAYGLSCDAFNKEAVKRIYNIKGRPKNKAVLLIVADLEMAKKYLRISEAEEKLAKKHWPCALSIILKSKSKKLNYQLDFGVRAPDNILCRAISKKLGRPIITTSANFSGGKTPYSVSAVLKEFAGKKCLPDLIVDVGRLKKVKPSTLINVEKEKVVVLRRGPIII